MNIPISKLKRIVIIGAGFGGLQVIKNINRNKFQIVLIDKNNYHTFHPLLYQVATSNINYESIIYNIRNIIKYKSNIYFRLANVKFIDTKHKKIYSNIGHISYDYLIISTGSKTNYFNNKNIKKYTMPMKSITEALYLKNYILKNLELATITSNIKEKKFFMNFVIIGGGPTGVELAGAFAELKKYVFADAYPDLDISNMKIYLIQATYKLLDGMSDKASNTALLNLTKMGVKVLLNTPVKNYDGRIVYTDKKNLESFNVIWAAGVKGALINGISKKIEEKGRLLVNEYNQLINHQDIFAIGDIAIMKSDKNYPNGHPMIAQAAIQQGKYLAYNLNCLFSGKKMKKFKYKNLGAMAIIGKHKAVCDLYIFNITGFFSWLIWLFVHLFSLIGFRNKIIILINWITKYIQYNQILRYIIKYKYKCFNHKK